MKFKTIKVKTPEREILVDITGKITQFVRESGIKEGICRIFIPHTTAAITINENADPAVKTDIIQHLRKLIPKNASFSHMEGNSDAHIKSTLTSPSLTVLIHEGKVVLGTWQGIMFAEYDGPRNRKVHLQVEGKK
ncbi:MAG: YjbQ family protein [Promethearchaeota archaeon]|nr:MAG: YjbQ family protein [Candidatus Lokiarchaeota archaeon]